MFTFSKFFYQKHKLGKILLSSTSDYGLRSHIFPAIIVRNFWIDSNINLI